MITCKEDLINTYVDHTNSELFSAWFELVKDIVDKDGVSIHWLKQNKYCSVESGKSGELFVNSIDGIWLKGKRELTLSDLKPTKQYAILHKGGSYSFQSDMPIGNDVVACFDLAHSEKPLGEDFFDENRQDDKQMKTYNTYQEAKIANPECEIAVKKKAADDFGDAICFQAVVADSSWSDGYVFSDDEDSSPRISDGYWKICNPADHCMTVKEFLGDGYRFEDGDLYLNSAGSVEKIDTAEFCKVMNGKDSDGMDNFRHVLSAAALEKPKQIIDTARKAFSTDSIPKLKRTKIEFVKVDDSIWHLEPDFRRGELFAFDGNRDYVQIETEGDFTLSHSSDNIYRRIETEIDERQEFIDAAIGYSYFTGSTETELILLENMYDSGKFKLVN